MATTVSSTATALASAAYALFALQQSVPLAALAKAAPTGTFPMAATQTPGWFAAAASQESSLLDTAPELQALPGDDDAERVDVSGLDLIHVYAPELQSVEELDEPAPPPQPPARLPAAEKPRTSTQIGLLKELSNLDT